MKIFITGGTGFIGSKLIKRLSEDGHEIVCYVRDVSKARLKIKQSVEFVTRSTFPGQIVKVLEKCDAVINLAGEPIVKRWTKNNKKKIYNSRVGLTKELTGWISSCKSPPKVYICSSAIGYYGDRAGELLYESSSKSSGWLSSLCSDWERFSYPENPEKLTKTRVVNLRTGIVLGNGGALKKMLLPFKLGLGGILGNGKQWMSWIHIDDMVSIIVESINNDKIYGPVNCVAPVPVTNKTFTKQLGKVLKRPTIFPVPSFVLKIIFGESSSILLDSQKVNPKILSKNGFQWKYGLLREALEDLI
jgi:uncharacterized protein (TIGR01777 family)